MFYETSNKLRVEEKDVIQGLRSLRNRSVHEVLEDFEGEHNAEGRFLLGSTKTKNNEKSPNKSWQCARLFRQRNI